MTSGSGLPSAQRWSWEFPVPPRWVVLGDVGFDGGYEIDVPLALCTEVEGVFVDLPARPRERFTLVGCTPADALTDLANRLPGEQAGLGNVHVAASPSPPATAPSWWGEDLADLVVLAQRPSLILPGALDIDLDGFVRVDDRTDAVVRPNDLTEFFLVGPDNLPLGTCQDIIGLFRDEAEPPVPQVRLLGCQPEPPMLEALAAVGDSSDIGQHRRRIQAWVHLIATDGSISSGAPIPGTVQSGTPSRLGADLIDITVACDPQEPQPTGVLDVLEHWRSGRPTEKNLWAAYDRVLREHWTREAHAHRSSTPDKPPGTTYELDGRFVTNLEGFYCAIGEAINGPAGYFGADLQALHECLLGTFGARPPFRLIWHNSTIAREHLVAGYDRRRLLSATTFQDLIALLTEHQIEVDLR